MKRFASPCTFVAGVFAGAFGSMMLPVVLAGSDGMGRACVADIAPAGGDGVVNVHDLLAVISEWGDCLPPPECDPSGTWVNEVNPAYSCTFGLISFDIPQWTFSQSGATLTVDGPTLPGPFPMTGDATSCKPGEMFTVSRLNSGSCNETYTLSGTFSSENEFSGTFTASFTGGGCFECFSQSFNVTATRR